MNDVEVVAGNSVTEILGDFSNVLLVEVPWYDDIEETLEVRGWVKSWDGNS
jgi:hypothetical protein